MAAREISMKLSRVVLLELTPTVLDGPAADRVRGQRLAEGAVLHPRPMGIEQMRRRIRLSSAASARRSRRSARRRAGRESSQRRYQVGRQLKKAKHLAYPASAGAFQNREGRSIPNRAGVEHRAPAPGLFEQFHDRRNLQGVGPSQPASRKQEPAAKVRTCVTCGAQLDFTARRTEC
jgi:hypothetical protein